MAARVATAETQQKSRHDRHSRKRSFCVGDTAYAQNYNGNGKCIPGTIVELTGPVSVKVELENGTRIRRHHDQILARSTVDPGDTSPFIIDQLGVVVKEQEEHEQQEFEPREEDLEPNRELVRNYPARIRAPPDRFE